MPSANTQTADATTTSAIVEHSDALGELAKSELRKRSGSMADLLKLGNQLKDAWLFDLLAAS